MKSSRLATVSLVIGVVVFVSAVLTFITSYLGLPETHPLAPFAAPIIFLTYLFEAPLIAFSRLLGFPIVLPAFSVIFAILSFRKNEGGKQLLLFSMALVATSIAMYCSLDSLTYRLEVAEEGMSESAQNPVPVFEQYPVEQIYTGQPAAVDFTSHEAARAFRTVINRAAADGPNFAGYFTVATWGCGTACQSSAVVDARDGKIVAFGIPSNSELSFSIESRLLITNQPPENPGDASMPLSTSYFYVMENGQLKSLGEYDHVRKIYKPTSGFVSPVGDSGS